VIAAQSSSSTSTRARRRRYKKPATLSLAGAYERSARFADAVRWYERYATRWPEDAKAPTSCSTRRSARGAGRRPGRAGRLAAVRRALPRRPDAARIAFNIGLLLERQKEWKKAAGHWREFQRGYARSAPPGQLLLARYKEGLARREGTAGTPARRPRSPR